MRTERRPLCGKEIDAGDVDAIQVHGGDGGLVHEGCIEERDDEPGLFQDPESAATGRAAASFECSVVELARERRERAIRTRRRS